ncbi:MAG: AAA family ATPase, partial [Verrucomicrobiota bacterium]
MILRSLELAGFKSFADRTRIHFDPGVTAIVGPNGCGKSNVVDAIRWVLGETSARALRGGEMADVIFNGTERRRPLGLAEVSLTLSGCEDLEGWEGHEVAIGRRVFRDGKSEYLLNRRSCRLRDIQNLFVDTGVGTSFYSIMEQGKIDLLLSSKPEDRREVFEEAAGITKYKQQKREALRKLEQTETNLIRLTDVLDEQERQLASLQRQAQRARRYAELRHLLYVLDTQISRMQWVAYQKSWDLEYEQWRSLEEKKQAIHQELQRRQSKVTELRSQRVALSDEILTVRESLSKAEALRSETHLRISQNESRVEEWRRLQSQMEEELVILQDQRKKESTQVEASCADQEGASTRLSALTESLQSG